jgi:hypothetical protein
MFPCNLTQGPNDHEDHNPLSKFQELPNVQQRHDEEDNECYDSTSECWDIAVHLPVELGGAWRISHLVEILVLMVEAECIRSIGSSGYLEMPQFRKSRDKCVAGCDSIAEQLGWQLKYHHD